MNFKPHDLLVGYQNLLKNLDRTVPVLDLACGNGCNGLMLARLGIPVVFADKSGSALETVQQQLKQEALPGRVWQVDLESPNTKPLSDLNFSAIIVFRYLHRPLFPALLNAVIPGGLVIYETFTTENRQFGRPVNPDFLLLPGELETIFRGWDIIFYFEGIRSNPEQAISQIVARKPAE